MTTTDRAGDAADETGFTDYYALLDVAPDTAEAELRTRLVAELRKWNGRAGMAPDLKTRHRAEARVETLNAARKELLDAAGRADYDRRRAEHAQRAASDTDAEPQAEPQPRQTPPRRQPEPRQRPPRQRTRPEPPRRTPKPPPEQTPRTEQPPPEQTPRQPQPRAEEPSPEQKRRRAARNWADRAERSYHADDLPTALYEAEQALREDDRSAKAWFVSAEVHRIQGDDPRAARYGYQRAVELDGDNPAYQHGLALTLYAAGRPEEAARRLERAIRQDPSDDDRRRKVVETLRGVGDYRLALELATARVGRGGPDVQVWRNETAALWGMQARRARDQHPSGALVITSPEAARTVAECAANGLAAEPDAPEIVRALHADQAEARRAVRRTWGRPRRAVPMVVVGGVLFVFGGQLPGLPGIIAAWCGLLVAVGGPIVRGFRPRWWHNRNRF